MRVMRLNRELFNETCLIMSGIFMFFLIVGALLFRLTFTTMLSDCGTADFISGFCKAVSASHVQGGACDWVCGADGKRRPYTLCPQSDYHIMNGSVFLRTSVSPSGAVLAMNISFLRDVLTTYQAPPAGQHPGETFHQTTSRIRDLLRTELNGYLNEGDHEVLLNSLPPPTMEPVPPAYVQSLVDIVKDKRFILSLLFYGTGERDMEPPGSATESVSAVSLKYTCGGLYQTHNLVNYTTPLVSVLNKPASGWSIGAKIDVYRFYEAVIHLLDLEESVSEHAYEGDFVMCNLNTSQVLLHSDCVSSRQSLYIKLSKPCTLKVLDISESLFSKDQVQRELTHLTCTKDIHCRFHSCMGLCNKGTGRCESSPRTMLAGLLQICRLLKSVEGQLLESISNKTMEGELYYAIDKCLDLNYFPLDMPDSAQHLVSTYNIIFQELKLLFITLTDSKTFQYKNELEEAAARKEAAKHKKT